MQQKHSWNIFFKSLIKCGVRIFSPTQVVLLTTTFFFSSFAMAYEVETHKQLTDKAIESIESQLNTYLIENLDLKGGLNEQLGIFNARGWMIEGSNFEDNGIRPLKHFHDPISDTGLTGLGDSAIDWSLQPLGGQSGGAFSWNDAREYYFKALTSSTKTERDENWGKTFRALGQVMHLLQDQASPAHVRNDPHLAQFGIGDVDGLHDFMDKRDVATYVGLGIISPDLALLEDAHQTQPVPMANLFDHNQYTGADPSASLGGQAGLAEYTNANFFSDDRIAGQIGTGSLFFQSYPHPSLSELVPAPVPSPYLTLARLGSAAFPGARAAKLTGNQAVATFLLTNTNLDLLGQLQLDEAVYDAQAQNLIPRAVGYSAAVLDYFFRGELPIQGSGQCHEPDLQQNQFWVDFTVTNLAHYQQGEGFVLYFQDPNGQWIAEDFIPVREGSLRLGGGYLGGPTTVKLAIVYDGPLGPAGAVELRGIVAQAHKFTDFTQPCLQ